jgi:hypothetical protein
MKKYIYIYICNHVYTNVHSRQTHFLLFTVYRVSSRRKRLQGVLDLSHVHAKQPKGREGKHKTISMCVVLVVIYVLHNIVFTTI